MPLLADRCQVAVKLEAVPGTAETLAAANVVMTTERPTWDADPEMIPRAVSSASVDSRGLVVGSRMAKISFKMFQRGTTGAPVDPSNLPDHVIPSRASGLLAAVSGTGPNEITTITPSSLSSVVTATVATYGDGKEYKIHGAVANVKKTYTVGSPVLLEFEFTGIFNTPTDVALLAPTYPAVVEPPFLGATLTVQGYAAKLKTITIDMGNKIALRPQPNLTGFLTAVITGRDIKGSIDVEEELASAKNWYAEWIAATLGSITTGTFPSNGTNYNQILDTYPNVQYAKVGHADRDGVVTAPIDFVPRANSDGGNDAFSWVQT